MANYNNGKTRKALFIAVIIFLAGIYFLVAKTDQSQAAYDDEVIDVNLEISGTIANDCDNSVTMGAITGTGQSALTTNEATCTVATTNSTGYALTFSSATTYLENANGDQIDAYSPGVAGTPETWSVPSSVSEWGARLKKAGTTSYDNKWGATADDTYGSTSKWHNVTNSGGFTIVSTSTETAGDTEILQFGAEVGSSKFQPTGTYDVDVTVTATTL